MVHRRRTGSGGRSRRALTHRVLVEVVDPALEEVSLGCVGGQVESRAIGGDRLGVAAELSQQVEVLQRCAELTAAAMPNLQSMQSLDEYWIEVNRLENTGDKNHRRIIAKLFSGEFKTIEVLKLKDIVESLEEAIDAFEKVANTVEQIAVKES